MIRSHLSPLRLLIFSLLLFSSAFSPFFPCPPTEERSSWPPLGFFPLSLFLLMPPALSLYRAFSPRRGEIGYFFRRKKKWAPEGGPLLRGNRNRRGYSSFPRFPPYGGKGKELMKGPSVGKNPYGVTVGGKKEGK